MFDQAELLERVDNDMEFLAETVAMLASDGPTLLAELRGAIGAGDAPGVARHAHALKGMISNFCAPEVQAEAQEIEQMGKRGDLSGALPALEAMEGRVGALTGALRRFTEAGA